MNDNFNFTKPKKKKQQKGRRGDGFFEALGDIGRSVGKSIKTDLVGNTAKNIHDQLINAAASEAPPEQNSEDFDFAKWIKAKENEISQKSEQEGREKERAFQHARQPEKLVFSLADEKVKKEIQAVRQELKLLVETIGNVEQQIEKAIIQEVVNPGVYHLNFFDKLKTWLQFVRKSIQGGELWMEMWSSRTQKSAYWKGVKGSGTKFMLSQERYMATQAG